MNFEQLILATIEWADNRSLIDESNANRQMLKVMEEVGELASGLAKKDRAAIADAIGDSFVTLIILATQLRMSPTQCLYEAYQEIANRTGKTVDGVFIKD
jgi:NTP pyrophosphatase (non-canonical NTP hydrolase)